MFAVHTFLQQNIEVHLFENDETLQVPNNSPIRPPLIMINSGVVS